MKVEEVIKRFGFGHSAEDAENRERASSSTYPNEKEGAETIPDFEQKESEQSIIP